MKMTWRQLDSTSSDFDRNLIPSTVRVLVWQGCCCLVLGTRRAGSSERDRY